MPNVIENEEMSFKLDRVLRNASEVIVSDLLQDIIGAFDIYTHLDFMNGKDKLLEIRSKYLESSGKLPIIFAFNHVDKPEIFWVTKLAFDVLDWDIEKLMFPVSEHYTHFKNYPPYAMLVWLAKKIGHAQMLSIFQAYRGRTIDSIKNIEESNLQKIIGRINEFLIKVAIFSGIIENQEPDSVEKQRLNITGMNVRLIRELMKGFKQGKSLIMAPEGHRSKIGLLPGEEGVGKAIVILASQNALIVPIGVSTIKEKTGYDPRKQFSLVVGKALSPQELIEYANELGNKFGISYDGNEASLLAHSLMMKIADLLPDEQKGVYHLESPYFLDVLNGKIKSGIIDSRGNVGLVRVEDNQFTAVSNLV